MSKTKELSVLYVPHKRESALLGIREGGALVGFERFDGAFPNDSWANAAGRMSTVVVEGRPNSGICVVHLVQQWSVSPQMDGFDVSPESLLELGNIMIANHVGRILN